MSASDATTESPEAGAPDIDHETLFRAFKSTVLELERLAERSERSASAAETP
jgi:hypothetical protein